MVSMVIARPVKATAASTAFATIRGEILDGTLPPGQRLKIDALCKRLDSSINPVREALNRLSAEGLVRLEDQRGFSVAPVSLDEWRELVRGRCLVEGAALREAIANRTPEWEEGIILALHWLSRTPRFADDTTRKTNPEWEPRHHAFHNALLVTCKSRMVLEFCEDLRDRSDRYRRVAALSPKARKTYSEEHRQIADAAIAGDADGAVGLLTTHYQRTLEVVEAFFTKE